MPRSSQTIALMNVRTKVFSGSMSVLPQLTASLLAVASVFGLGENLHSEDRFIVQPTARAHSGEDLVSPASVSVPSIAASHTINSKTDSPIFPIRPVSGWESIGQQLLGHLSRSEQLSRRGVLLSAREEAHQALLILARHLDLLSNHFVSEPGLQAAETALREVNDLIDSAHATDLTRIRHIIDSHECPVLKETDLGTASPLALAQHYRYYAERKLIDASRDHPWFSDILYVLGRTYQAEADRITDASSDCLRARALVYYRAALEIRPSNALAANQIGFLLLRLDRPLEAKGFLLASVRHHPEAAALQNLVEASRRLGDRQTELWARQTLAATTDIKPSERPHAAVEVLDQRTFAALSPMSAGPKNRSPESRTANLPAESASFVLPNRQTGSSTR
jgi:tetratricopeptide (TPR) repeat protein